MKTILGYLNKYVGSDIYSFKCYEENNKFYAVKVVKHGDKIKEISLPFEIKKRYGNWGFWKPLHSFYSEYMTPENIAKYPKNSIVKKAGQVTYKYGAKVIYADEIYFGMLDQNGKCKKYFEMLNNNFDTECRYALDLEF